QKDYPPAWLLCGKILLTQSKPGEALESLKLAAERNPLPEYQWALADALRESGCEEEARKVEAEIKRHGAATDPRTFALYLSARRESPDLSIALSRKEL